MSDPITVLGEQIEKLIIEAKADPKTALLLPGRITSFVSSASQAIREIGEKALGLVDPSEVDSTLLCPRRRGQPNFNIKIRPTGDIVENVCQYCGSMSESAFFDAIAAGAVLCPTDKDYKVYVSSSDKFYFYHLSDEGQKRFVDMMNAKTLKFIGPTPGFYVKPFFVK